MVKKRPAPAAMTTTTMPVFPFTAAPDETEPPHHFSDYGFDPQLLCFSQLPDTKRAAARRHHHQLQQPPPQLEHARFKLEKPISKKNQHTQKHREKQQRRRWWSSVASAALLFFKRRPSSSRTARTAGAASSSPCGRAAFAPTGPLYFADDGGDDSTGCTCWSPAVPSGVHLAAAELGVASVVVPYVSLRDVRLGGGGGGAGGVAPSMPIYLVT